MIPRVSNFACNQNGNLALPTVPGRVRCLDASTIIDTNVMLDPGTNATYCTEELCEMLGARGVIRHMELTTIDQTRLPIESTIITLLISDLHDTENSYCIPEVTVRPMLNIELSGLSSLELDHIHMLIGQD